MAQVVLGFASSHGPTMSTPPERWGELGAIDEDRADATVWGPAFAALLPRPEMEEEVTIERCRERYAAVRRAVSTLAEVMREAHPEVVVVFSNPHGGYVPDRAYPPFGMYLSDAPPVLSGASARRTRGRMAEPVDQLAPSASAVHPGASVRYPAEGELARYLMEGLIQEGVDVAAIFQSRPGTGLDSAFNLLYREFDEDMSIPYVPVLVSRYLPNQATPRRVYEFGQAVRRVLDRWDSPKRVAIMGSGGLSHQIVDEEQDRAVIGALQNGDTGTLFAIDRQRLNRSGGTPETLNWLACAGAMAPKTMILIDYVPCYRSLMGTGHGNTFGYWM